MMQVKISGVAGAHATVVRGGRGSSKQARLFRLTRVNAIQLHSDRLEEPVLLFSRGWESALAGGNADRLRRRSHAENMNVPDNLHELEDGLMRANHAGAVSLCCALALSGCAAPVTQERSEMMIGGLPWRQAMRSCACLVKPGESLLVVG